MKYVFTSYASAASFSDPHLWLQRISGYTGILESLTKTNEVNSIERINFKGLIRKNGVAYHFHRQQKKVAYFPWKQHQLIKSLQPDAVFVNGFIFPMQVIQLRLALGKKVKIVVINRSEKPSAGIKKLLQKKANQYIQNYLFASSDFGEDWIKSGIIDSPNKINEVLHGSSHFQPQNRYEAKKITGIHGPRNFLWVGRLDANKDPITVLHAFVQYLEKEPSAKLYMIFHTDELLPQVEEIIAANDSAKNAIVLVGKVVQSTLQHWYNAADFIISGSHYEGGGISVCEAMSCGCIPIITNIPSFKKMTKNGAYGYLYEPGNEEQLFQLLLKTNTIDIEKERAKVREQFVKEFSFDALAKKIENVVATL